MPTIRRYPYNAQAVADATGRAVVVFNGPPSGYISISSLAVNVTGSTPIPVCTAYEGSIAAPGRVLAVLRAGDRGSFTGDPGDRLTAGQQLTVEWTGCTAGATCYATLYGETWQP